MVQWYITKKSENFGWEEMKKTDFFRFGFVALYNRKERESKCLKVLDFRIQFLTLDGQRLDGLSRQRIWLWMNYLNKGEMDYLDKGINFWLQMVQLFFWLQMVQLLLKSSLQPALAAVFPLIQIENFSLSYPSTIYHMRARGKSLNIKTVSKFAAWVEWRISDRGNHRK